VPGNVQRPDFALAPLERLPVLQELGLARDASAIAFETVDPKTWVLGGDFFVATDVIVVVVRGKHRAQLSSVLGERSTNRSGLRYIDHRELAAAVVEQVGVVVFQAR